MPKQKRKIILDGESVEVEDVAIKSSSETPNTYQLEDGSVLTMRTVVLEVARLVDKYDKDGNPVYSAKSTNIISARSPESLRKKA